MVFQISLSFSELLSFLNSLLSTCDIINRLNKWFEFVLWETQLSFRLNERRHYIQKGKTRKRGQAPRCTKRSLQLNVIILKGYLQKSFVTTAQINILNLVNNHTSSKVSTVRWRFYNSLSSEYFYGQLRNSCNSTQDQRRS